MLGKNFCYKFFFVFYRKFSRDFELQDPVVLKKELFENMMHGADSVSDRKYLWRFYTPMILSFGFPVSISKWLTSTNNALVYYGQYPGNLVNTNLDAGRLTFNFKQQYADH